MNASDHGSRSRYRQITSPEERLSDLHLVIEPGFIHHRAIDARLPEAIRREVDSRIERLPREPDFRFQLQVDQYYREADFAGSLTMVSFHTRSVVGRAGG